MCCPWKSGWIWMVALRKESVDRNEEYVRSFAAEDVALRKESVDRNAFSQSFRHFLCVALRKESVDRNTDLYALNYDRLPSLSARRAWIEILYQSSRWITRFVALRKESVDRNSCRPTRSSLLLGRSPQGERG